MEGGQPVLEWEIEPEVWGAENARFTVRFLTETGERFVLGPCCGATPEEMPPTEEFDFTVRQSGDTYRVVDLPVYVP
jgi:hypothetical protein